MSEREQVVEFAAYGGNVFVNPDHVVALKRADPTALTRIITTMGTFDVLDNLGQVAAALSKARSSTPEGATGS